MSFPQLFVHFIGGAVGSTILTALVIIIGTFILEDPTTVLVGLLAASGVIAVPTALLSLYAGIVLGDLSLYGLGSLARSHPRLGRYVDHDIIAPLRVWLETRYVLTIFSVRFVPGLRLPTYTASGFFRSPLGPFIATAIGATAVWTTLLFSASYWYGNLTSTWLGWVRWALAGVVLLILFFIGRHNLMAYRKQKAKLDKKRSRTETNTK